MENSKKTLTDILGFDPAKSENERVQKLAKEHGEREQQSIEAWTKRQKELAAPNEVKLERAVVDTRENLATHQTAISIARELGMQDKLQDLAAQRPTVAREHEQSMLALDSYQHTQQVQQRLEKVQGGSESYQTIAQAHTRFANDLADGGTKANNEFIAGEKASQPAPAEARQAPQQAQVEPMAQQPSAPAKQVSGADEKPGANDLLQRYQDQGDIGRQSFPSQRFPSRGYNFPSEMMESAINRFEQHREIINDIDEKLMTNDQIAAIEDPEERERLKAGQVTDPVAQERLKLVRDLEVNHYEATTSRQAANVVQHVGGSDSKETAAKMNSAADDFEIKRDAALNKLAEFDQAQEIKASQAEGQFKRAADKPETAEQAAPAQAKPETNQEGSKMIKSTEMEAPKNAAAARLAARVQANEAAGAKPKVDADVKERFAHSQTRSDAMREAQQQKQSDREATKQRPASM